MQFLIDNWLLFVIAIAVVVTIGVAMWRFAKMPTREQIAAVKEWLVGIVIEAERELGSGTGALKLRQVYDMFVIRFPWLAKIVPFGVFAAWVDEALEVMREMLASNDNVCAYVYGAEEDLEEPRKVSF